MDNQEDRNASGAVTPDTPQAKGNTRQESVEALEPSATISKTLQSLLKSPDSLGARISEGGFGISTLKLIIVCIACSLGYGLITGSFSGGAQWYASPLKMITGLFLTSLFCLPSLYIFSCISGADIRLGQVAGILIAADTLTTVLLIGLGPVAWVFSQSTNSVFFMGLLHLVFWLVAFGFGMNLMLRLARHLKPKDTVYLKIWILIFLLTSIQMMTALRPLIGTSDYLLPKEKKFFLKHWIETANPPGTKSEAKQEKPSRQEQRD